MRIAVTGASGLIGSALCESFAAANIQVLKLVRRPVATATEIRWDPVQGVENLALLENLDAVVHLAGAGVGDKRLSSEYKKQIRDSRIQGTQTIARSLAALTDKPKVLISASAIGWYGDTGEIKLMKQLPVQLDSCLKLCGIGSLLLMLHVMLGFELLTLELDL